MIQLYKDLQKLINEGEEITITSAIPGSTTLIYYCEIGGEHIVLINQRFQEHKISTIEELNNLYEVQLVHGFNNVLPEGDNETFLFTKNDVRTSFVNKDGQTIHCMNKEMIKRRNQIKSKQMESFA